MDNTATYPTRSVKLDEQTYKRVKRRAKEEGRTITGLLRLLSFAPTPPIKLSDMK